MNYTLQLNSRDKHMDLKKNVPTVCCLQNTHFRLKDANRMKVKDGKRHTNSNNQRAGVAMLILDKIDDKTKNFYKEVSDNNKRVKLPRRYYNCKHICT